MFNNEGVFNEYKNPTHELASFGAAFFRNEQGKDWYELQVDLGKRTPPVVQSFLVENNDSNRVLRTVSDPSLLAPAGVRVITSTEVIQIDEPGNYTWDGTAIVRAVRDDELSAEAAREAFNRVLNAYPPTPTGAIDEVMAMDFDGIDIAPITRPSDGKAVGMHITYIYDDAATGGVRSLRALNTFDTATLERGIPSIQILDTDPAQLNKDRYAEHILARFSSFQAIYGRDRNYVYRPMSVEQWAARQWHLIKEARLQASIADIDFKETSFQADDGSRQNLLETIAAVDGGWTLPDNFTWRDAGNVDVIMTADELRQLAGLMAAQKNAAYRASWTARGTINTIVANSDDEATKIAAIQAVELTIE